MQMSRVWGWIAAQVQLLLLYFLCMVYSHTNVVVVKSHMGLLNESVLGRFSVSGDRFLWQVGTKLVHGFIVSICGGNLICISLCLGKLCWCRCHRDVVLLTKAVLESRLVKGGFDTGHRWLRFGLWFHGRSVLALSSWLFLHKFIIQHRKVSDVLALAVSISPRLASCIAKHVMPPVCRVDYCLIRACLDLHALFLIISNNNFLAYQEYLHLRSME